MERVSAQRVWGALYIVGALTFTASGAQAGSALPSGPYFGQVPPGDTPKPFATEFLSARYPLLGRIAFSANGDACFFTVSDSTYVHPQIYATTRKHGVWTAPAIPDFLKGQTLASEPFVSADGARLYFTSDGDPKSSTNKRDLWMTTRAGNGWSKPHRLPAPINTDFAEWFLSQPADKELYFVSNRPGGLGGTDIYRAQGVTVQNLGEPVNSKADDWDLLVLPGGDAIVFVSTRAGGHGGIDLYISRSNGHGGWTSPENLGDAFNTAADEYAPSLSPDGKFLFFVRNDGKSGRLYWVKTTALDHFRARGNKAKGN